MEGYASHLAGRLAQRLLRVYPEVEPLARAQAMLQMIVGSRARIHEPLGAGRGGRGQHDVVDPESALFLDLHRGPEGEEKIAAILGKEIPAFVDLEMELFPFTVDAERKESRRRSIDEGTNLAIGRPAEDRLAGSIRTSPEANRVSLAALGRGGCLGG